MAQQAFDFLSQSSEERLRYEAVNILDSYAHPWDVLAEALQNSVDAVEERYKIDPKVPNRIFIELNVAKRGISVIDTGVGMDAATVNQALTPNISFKRGKGTRGEKGIGLSFIVLSSNRFELETCDGKETTSLYVENANDWVREVSPERPMAEPSKKGRRYLPPEIPTYTRVSAQGIPPREDVGVDIFSDYTLPRLVHVLRTKTAVGNTTCLFTKDGPPPVNIEVFLTYVAQDGSTRSDIRVPYRYADPSVYLDPSEWLDLPEFEKVMLKYPDKARGKSILMRGETRTPTGRKIRYFAFASSRKTFDSISEKHELETDVGGDVQAGIFVSTRGMPTGITIEPPKTAAAGYWHNYYIVLEDDDLRLDLGRKSLRGRSIEMFKRVCVHEIWSKTVHYISEIIPHPIAEDIRDEEKLQKLWDESKKRQKLDIDGIGICRAPEYEQEDVALFHELVGAEILKGYRTYRTNYVDPYDELVNYSIHANEIGSKAAQAFGKKVVNIYIIVEFKHRAIDLLDDIERFRKKYEHVTLLVCWDICADEFAKNDVEVEEVPADEVLFHGTTHKLLFPNQFGLGARSERPVICLEDLVAKHSK